MQLGLQGGALSGHRRHGRTVTVDDLAAQAWSRSLGRGRVWTARTRTVALDLLSGGQTTEMSSSERSRLRARLRTMSTTQIAHTAGGLGAWARYRGIATDDMTRIGPSAADATSTMRSTPSSIRRHGAMPTPLQGDGQCAQLPPSGPTESCHSRQLSTTPLTTLMSGPYSRSARARDTTLTVTPSPSIHPMKGTSATQDMWTTASSPSGVPVPPPSPHWTIPPGIGRLAT